MHGIHQTLRTALASRSAMPVRACLNLDLLALRLLRSRA